MIIVLAYHSISNARYEHAVTPEVFEMQLQLLKKRCTLISIGELARLIQSKEKVNGNYAVVTFDDGTNDIYEYAFPILKKLNIPGAVFVCTGHAGKTQTNASGATFTFLTWEQMKEMQESGLVTIESHTHTHPLLTTLDDATLEKELITSKQEIQTHLGGVAENFAYPKGNYDDRVKNITGKHYRFAFGSVGVIEDTGVVDPLVIPRVIVSANIPLWKFKSMTYSWYWRLKKYRDYFLA